MAQNQIKLRVIPEPAPKSRAVYAVSKPDIVIFNANGNTDLLCGNCNTVIVRGFTIGLFITEKNPVFLCNNCNSYNELQN
jgi:hypothetical protein